MSDNIYGQYLNWGDIMDIKGISSSQYHISASNIRSNRNVGEKEKKSMEAKKPLASKDRRIQALENQKSKLVEQIGKIKESDCDYKLKQERITEIKKQIQEIDSQIRQAKLESITKKDELKETTEKQENKIDERKKKDNKNKGGVDSSRVEHLTKIDNIYSEIKGFSKLRTYLKGEARVKNAEIGADSSRGANVSDKIEELVEIEGRIEKIEKNMGKYGNEIQEEIKRSSEEENNTAEKENKIEDTNKNENGKDSKDKNRKSLDFYI